MVHNKELLEQHFWYCTLVLCTGLNLMPDSENACQSNTCLYIGWSFYEACVTMGPAQMVHKAFREVFLMKHVLTA